jgi:hypothetical protein
MSNNSQTLARDVGLSGGVGPGASVEHVSGGVFLRVLLDLACASTQLSAMSLAPAAEFSV